MSEQNTLTMIAEEIGSALSPLKEAFDSQEDFIAFMAELGWDFNTLPNSLSDLISPITTIVDVIEDGELDSDTAPNVIQSIKAFVNAANGVSIPGSAGPSPAEFGNDFPPQLVQFLIVEYLLTKQPDIGNILRALGVILVEEQEATATRLAYTSKTINWSGLGDMISNPFALIESAYKWGEADFKDQMAYENLFLLGEGLGFQVRQEGFSAPIMSFLKNGAAPGALNEVHNQAIKLPFLAKPDNQDGGEVGIAFYILPNTGGNNSGLAILPYASATFEEEIELGEDWFFTIEAIAEIAGGVSIAIRPGTGIQVQLNIGNSPAGFPGGAAVALGLVNRDKEGGRQVIIGSADGSRFDMKSFGMKAGARLDGNADPNVFVELNLEDANIVIDPSGGDSDSFINSMLPSDGFKIDFDLLLGFSTLKGLYFGGSGGLEISLPTHIDLKIIEINAATIALKVKDGKVPIELGATIKGNLGPLKAVVENMGLRATLSFPGDESGNLGPADLDLGFKPPNGVGLSIDAGVVQGGGYLFFDFDKEEYAGALELTFAGFLSLKAIGIVTTRMPDGSKGFSLLIIVTAEFGSGIQLGFGFTLIGVGGLLGLNRTMRLEQLAEGVRTGSVNSVMFPQNVVENAPRIISDLKNFFPAKEGIFLIGPMAKLGWGTPTLVSVSIGIIIEIPGNIAILGVLKVVLPDEKAALLVLQIKFIGAIEFDKKRLWFFASMFGSRVLFITLDGELGLLVGWGDDANFVISVGGFHPRFEAPPLPFPEPRRIAVSVLNESWGRIRVEGYFAVTSNTVQFGARAELYFGLSALNVSGHLAFDALFQFSPFFFIIEISCSVELKVFGAGLFSISLKFSLEGPTPWRAKGKGKLKILFFSVSANFDFTWGDKKNTTLEPIEVMPIITAEYELLENWTAELPAANTLSVSLRKLEEEETEQLVLHPVGFLRISQRAVPLEVTLDKVGSQAASDVNKLRVAANPGASFGVKDEAEESFAMAQFQNMKDSEKLSRPSFEKEKSGLELSVTGQQLQTSKGVTRHVRYEEVIIDNNFKRISIAFFAIIQALFNLFLNNNAIAKAPISAKSAKELIPPKEKIKVGATGYAVAFNRDNKKVNDQATRFNSEAQARTFMENEIQRDPNLRSQIHVIPVHELNQSAA